MKLLHSLFDIKSIHGQSFTIRLHPEHAIYQVHFPGHPITPGVFILQIITELAETRTGQKLLLQDIKNLKFIRPLIPEKDCDLEATMTVTTENSNNIQIKGVIQKKEKLLTKYSITAAYE